MGGHEQAERITSREPLRRPGGVGGGRWHPGKGGTQGVGRRYCGRGWGGRAGAVAETERGENAKKRGKEGNTGWFWAVEF